MTTISLQDGHAAHAQPGHPERPARLDAIRTAIETDPVLAALPRLSGFPASVDDLARVHPEAYLDLVETFCATGGGQLDADTYATAASWDVARQACGDLLALVDAVCTGGARTAFALGRPPGHHARPFQAMGFCLIANVAVAARHAQAVHGAERVMIVDVDVHHGNGTQEVFEADPSVLFVSSHQADIYPGTGRLGETGVGAGEGLTVNLPVPGGTANNLVDLYRTVLPPLAERFRPDLVLVSAGYDGHYLDPLGSLGLSVTGLSDLLGVVHEAADRWAEGRMVLTLEGGYQAEALAACVAAALHRLIDPSASVADPFGPTLLGSADLGPLTEAVRGLHGV
ncbi:MAG: histone deacetylase [Bacteroidota bacterium]